MDALSVAQLWAHKVYAGVYLVSFVRDFGGGKNWRPRKLYRILLYGPTGPEKHVIIKRCGGEWIACDPELLYAD